ncbi:centromere protein T-like isoform X2 [Acanthaster planci]|uniref:Centromere protein T-like isoform X2 n=1 Tax=Acanthaster planci TaxID=133434 RepID=A0A8B7ZQE6_ACAPL|nr:centromere protein T-like isoform X2 [Acanthaster planci]
MATDDVTPRTLIQGFIEASSVSKSAASTSRVRVRRSNTGNRVAALRKDDKMRAQSISDLTPRSLIQGVIQNNEVEEPPPSKKPRKSPPETEHPPAKTPGTLPHSTARKRVTRLEALATPGGNPTPRSLIQGLVGTAPVETPAVHVRRSSSLNPTDFPDVEEALQGRANKESLSPLVPEPTDTTNQSQPPATNARKRQQVSSEDFATGIQERLVQRQGGDTEEEEEEAGEVGDVTETEDVQESISEDAGDGSQELAESEENLQDTQGDIDDKEDEAKEQETADVPDDAGEPQDESIREEEAHPDSAISTASTPSTTPASQATPPADRTSPESTSKQAADSTWTGREPEASIPSQREGSPGGTRRVPDSTVLDPSSEGGEAVPPDQPTEEESSIAEDSEAQQTTGGGESRLSGFSPLVTPRLPSGSGRPTPALKKTPAHRQEAAQREEPSSEVQKQGPKKKKQPPMAPRKEAACLPTSLTRSILSHFSKARVSKEAVAAVEKGVETFFKRLSNDLTAYSRHAHRQTIEQSDVELLMRRQGLIRDQQSMYALIEKYLPMEYRQELIPMATAGNKVTPKPSH